VNTRLGLVTILDQTSLIASSARVYRPVAEIAIDVEAV